MTSGVSIESRQGLTLEEMRRFLEQCQLAEIPADSKPVVRVTLGGKVKRVEVKS